MVGDAAIALTDGRGDAEEHLLAFHGGASEQLADDSANHRQAVRFVGIEYSVRHGTTGFQMKDFGELLRLVAGDHDVRALHLMEHLFALQEALRQLGIRYGQECVELGVVLTRLVCTASHNDPAGADIEAQRLRIFLFGVGHHFVFNWFPKRYSYGRDSSRWSFSEKRLSL